MSKAFRTVTCVVALALAASASAATLSVPRGDDLAAHILAAHNRERASVGAPPLQWDDSLASSAASYGPALASIGKLVHSPRETRPGQRENLAMGWTTATNADELVGLWVNEKRLFHAGAFPNVSASGNWVDIAHYTQMIWKGTTRVGCAMYPAPNGWSYLICRYSPPGNIDGKPVP